MLKFLETPATVVHIVACLFLVLVVLIQPGKSGGLGAFGGGGAQQVFGGGGAGNVLTKTTWITAFMFFGTSVFLAYLSSSSPDSLEARARRKAGSAQMEPAPAKAPTPEKKP
jgi:preprotein translocase subunit SecG